MAVDVARAKSLFLAASDLDDTTERAAFLGRECGGDAELRAWVEALLLANDTAALPPAGTGDATLTHTSEVPEQTEEDRDPTVTVGSVLAGKYKLIEEIGEGGMGSVFMAQQTEPVKRVVAVKVIKAGMDSRAVLGRFEAERQALAMMDHANIARVLDAGSTATGRPFFVMELVKGKSITQYCDEQRLTPRQRLELFVPVCQAIQHAHQKGIIHRDIKPSNVLVALYDDKPVPKVIDFGVAKATGPTLTDKTLMTGFGAVVGTPEYMSPEQANLNNLDVDTRSDVYSLGVLLYELLTGSTPVDRKSLGKAAVLEILRIVREVEAPRPSAKLSTIDALPSVAANRSTEPVKLSKLMRGELDWVLLKALEKDRSRRYATANGLARDIQRYLADEVVEARPPSAGYRLKKFVRRHKGQVIAACLVLFALLAGMAGTTWGLIEARKQQQLAMVAREAEAERAEGERLARMEAVAATEKALAAEKSESMQRTKAEQNAQIAGMQATLALNTIQDLISQVQKGLQAPGLFDFKTALLDSALKRIDGVAGIYEKSTSKEATTAAALMELGKIFRQLGQTQKAFQSYQKCLEITKERVKIKNYSDPSRQNLANTYFELAFCSEELNRDMKATLGYNLDALKLYEDIYNKPKLDDFPLDRKIVRAGLAEAYTRVGVTHYRMGELTAALENYRKAYNLRRGLVDEQKDNPKLAQDLSYSMMALAESNFRLGDRALADDFYRQALAQREAMAKLKPNDLGSLKELGDVYYMIGEFKLRCGDLDAASRNLEKSRDRRKDLVDREPRNVLLGRDLGLAWYRLGNLADMEKHPDEAKRAYDASLGIRENLAKISEGNDRRQTELMMVLAHVGQTIRALELADRISAGPKVDREQRIFLACCYAQVARATPPEKSEQVQTALKKAVDAVRIAVREGFRDRVYLETEPDLEPIRGREDFKQILKEIRPG